VTGGEPAGRVGYVREAVLDAAAGLLVHNREATMAQIADAAGVGRATLYRHYENREALLRDLMDHAVSEVGHAIDHARIEAVDVREGIARVVRALLGIRKRFEVVLREFKGDPPRVALQERLGPPITALFERGRADGTLREDIPVDWLASMFRGIVKGAMEISDEIGLEEAAALATRQFLDGAGPDPCGAPQSG